MSAEILAVFQTVIARFNQFDLEMWLNVNPKSVCQYWRDSHIGYWMSRKSCFKALPTMVRGIRDLSMSAKLAANREKSFWNSVSKNADVYSALKIENRHQQPKPIAADLGRKRMTIIVIR